MTSGFGEYRDFTRLIQLSTKAVRLICRHKMNPETEDERRSRQLKELEGKNISHYSILLQTVIQSELDSIKTIITLSSVAIGVLITVGRFDGSYEIIRGLVIVVSLASFIVTIILGLCFLNQASTRYEEELMGARDNKELHGLIKARRKLTICRKIAFITFGFGIFVGCFLGFLGFLRFEVR